MSVPALLNTLTNQKDLETWAFNNYVAHVLIINAVNQKYNVSLNQYSIYPFDLRNATVWLQSHQQMHSDMDSVLNIAGNDLSDVDFNDPKQMTSWLRLHFQEHLQASQILGV